ncbi:hypothetical protein [Ruegeria sp. HKCCA4707]|uniref:hypothetical protein n=1 Tax=Ruegeria sp. HKCCA4707 TaxID=2682984 RepID=UPI0014895C98|nr:hypothetical protein [Ruegeria sp. HKCCA4707]
MTLRTIGHSISEGFQTVASQSFWDWPLWISVPVSIVYLLVLFGFVVAFRETVEHEREQDWVGAVGFFVLSFFLGWVCWLCWTLDFGSLPLGFFRMLIIIFGKIAFPLLFAGCFFGFLVFSTVQLEKWKRR